jgi:hypothetical protein
LENKERSCRGFFSSPFCVKISGKILFPTAWLWFQPKSAWALVSHEIIVSLESQQMAANSGLVFIGNLLLILELHAGGLGVDIYQIHICKEQPERVSLSLFLSKRQGTDKEELDLPINLSVNCSTVHPWLTRNTGIKIVEEDSDSQLDTLLREHGG